MKTVKGLGAVAAWGAVFTAAAIGHPVWLLFLVVAMGLSLWLYE